MFVEIVKIVALFGLFKLADGELGSNLRIVGGSPSSIAYPYQLSLQKRPTAPALFSNSDYRHFCGGVIINEHYLLTAAHCIEGQTITDISAVAGTPFWKDDSKGSRHSLDSCLIHPNHENMTNDIAVCRVKFPFVFGENIGKINLDRSYVEEGIDCTLTGWGSVSMIRWLPIPFYNLFAYPEHLQVVTLRTISTEQCMQTIVGRNDTQLCTLTRIGQGACAGDSGGPLECNGKLAGIVSYGTYVCAAGLPDAFTRVSSYYDWIMSNIAISSEGPHANLALQLIPNAFQDNLT